MKVDHRIGKIGENYEDGSLPYGGRTDIHGRITFVVSEEDYRHQIDLLRSD
jgi:hypothetical protein